MNKKDTSLHDARIVLAGGGSGGHITPLLAVYEELKKETKHILFIGDESELTKELVTQAGVRFASIPTGKLRRYWSLENLLTPWQVLGGIQKAVQILKDFRPDLVFAKGGFGSLPTVIAAHRLRIPIVIHESDAVMGLANRYASHLAQKICVSHSSELFAQKLQDKLVDTGVPVRKEFYSFHKRKNNKDETKTVFVTGGSQGAAAINTAVQEIAPSLIRKYNVIHVTGRTGFDTFKKIKKAGFAAYPFLTDTMAEKMASADLVISRASATTLAEIAAVGKPAILIPLPGAANDHQTANAAAWEIVHAAIVIPQKNLSGERLLRTIDDLFAHPDKLALMERAVQELATPDATQKILVVFREVLSARGRK